MEEHWGSRHNYWMANEKMIFYVRSSLAKYDARIQKYFIAVSNSGISYRYVGWIRGVSTYRPAENEFIYKNEGQLGARWGNAWSIIKWNIFVFFTLVKNRDTIQVIHAVDFDSGVIAYIFSRLFRKKFVFDIYDKYTAVRGLDGMIGRIIDKLERVIAKHADLTLLAGAERYEQMGIPRTQSNCIVLENVPLTSITRKLMPDFSGKWLIGYFGVLESKHRGLENLLAIASKRNDVELHLAGYGELESYILECSKKNSNIVFYGPLDSNAGLNIMSKMHIIAGMYYLSVPNHHYASPNKYYEHLMLGRGLLTTKHTAPGARVTDSGTGWAVGEDEMALDDWVSSLEYKKVTSFGDAAYELWNTKYSNYFQYNYQEFYVNKVKSILRA